MLLGTVLGRWENIESEVKTLLHFFELTHGLRDFLFPGGSRPAATHLEKGPSGSRPVAERSQVGRDQSRPTCDSNHLWPRDSARPATAPPKSRSSVVLTQHDQENITQQPSLFGFLNFSSFFNNVLVGHSPNINPQT